MCFVLCCFQILNALNYTTSQQVLYWSETAKKKCLKEEVDKHCSSNKQIILSCLVNLILVIIGYSLACSCNNCPGHIKLIVKRAIPEAYAHPLFHIHIYQFFLFLFFLLQVHRGHANFKSPLTKSEITAENKMTNDWLQRHIWSERKVKQEPNNPTMPLSICFV